jgi:hypothetical protein
MTRLWLTAAWISGGLACVPCGSFVLSGTTATDATGADYNGTWHEQCGAKMGTSGTWNLLGDGLATLDFFPSAAGDRDWMAIDLEISVSFPTDQVVSGETVTDLVGGAAINPAITAHLDGVGLTEGTIEVGGVQGTDDVCEGDGPTAHLTWDLTYGAEGGPLYVVKGSDRVLFMNFLSEDCPDAL